MTRKTSIRSSTTTLARQARDALPYKALFTNPVPGLSPTATSRDDQFGVYLQDDWAAEPAFDLESRYALGL